ncbi:MAG: hypothetical protein HWE16_16835 [Gammaproteobacteria bacterium]|nr:hypothetical protein [Gammaproteobacteria bacterium]
MKLKQLLTGAFAACFCASATFAVDPLELDGNTAKDTAADDWQNVNTALASGELVATGVVADLPPKTIFWKGGSKDINDVTQWWYKDGAVPDKDDLRNGYSAAYNEAGDLIFYFGAERFANNGDAIMGFWYFQDQVGPDGNNRFTGQHVENDLFIVMEYPQGSNAQPFVQVMRWVDSGGDVSDNLQLIYNSGDAGAKCNTASDPGVACAITNDSEFSQADWAFQSKTAAAGVYPVESFFEGRLNVTDALALVGVTEIPCFSSFLIETRSSRSETAQLKDFLGGEFPLCSIAVTKTCSASELTDGNQFVIDYTINLQNTGVGSIAASETVTVDDQPSNGDAFQVVQTVAQIDDDANGWAPNEIISFSGQYVSSVNGGSNTVDAQVSFGSSFITAEQYTADCDSLQLSPMLSIVKSCDLSLDDSSGVVAVRKSYEVEVCNTGDAPLDVTLTDNEDASLNESFSLDFPKTCLINADCGAGFSCNGSGFCEDGDGVLEGVFGGNVCNVSSGSYLPDTIPSGTAGSLTNTATAKATSPVVDTGPLATVGQSDSASCELCPLTQNQQD